MLFLALLGKQCVAEEAGKLGAVRPCRMSSGE